MMIELPPSEFSFAKYGWDHAEWDVISSHQEYIDWLLTQPIVGYCDGALIKIRPRPNDIAVMFDDDVYSGWAHIPKDVWKTFLKEQHGR